MAQKAEAKKGEVKKEEAIDVTTLPLQQIQSIATSLEQQVNSLRVLVQTSRAAHTRYEHAETALERVSNYDGEEVLVPVTESLYVPGKLLDTDKILVNIGTNFYVEKNVKETQAFIDRKKTLLSRSAKDSEEALKEKLEHQQQIHQVLNSKIQDQRKAQLLAQQK